MGKGEISSKGKAANHRDVMALTSACGPLPRAKWWSDRRFTGFFIGQFRAKKWPKNGWQR
jgi:hypothetical protein